MTKARVKPLNRHNQAKIAALIYEVKIALGSLRDQQSIVYDLETILSRGDERSFSRRRHISHTNPALIVLQDATTSLQGKVTSMKDLIHSAENLLEKVSVEFSNSQTRKQNPVLTHNAGSG